MCPPPQWGGWVALGGVSNSQERPPLPSHRTCQLRKSLRNVSRVTRPGALQRRPEPDSEEGSTPGLRIRKEPRKGPVIRAQTTGAHPQILIKQPL